MKIGYDAKRLFFNSTGLGNYSRWLVKAIAHTFPEESLFLFTPETPKSNRKTEFLKKLQNVKTVLPEGIYQTKLLNKYWRSYNVSEVCKAFKDLDIYHGLSHELPKKVKTSNVKYILTIHDIIFLTHPHFYKKIDAWLYKFKLKQSLKRADIIHCLSKYTKKTLMDFFPTEMKNKPTTVVYQGCDSQFYEKKNELEINNFKAHYGLKKKYLLNVSTIEPRKNQEKIIRVFAGVKKEFDIQLVIVGRKTSYFSMLQKTMKEVHLTNRDVIFLHDVPFSDFPLLYQGAEILIYPSLVEGFGIPILEAINSEIPVITTKNSCMEEAAGEGGVFIDPTNVSEMEYEIKKILDNHIYRQQLIQKGNEHKMRFREDILMPEIMGLYSTAMELPPQ